MTVVKPTLFPVRWASIVPGWITKVSLIMAITGIKVVSVSSIPKIKRIRFWGFEKMF